MTGIPGELYSSLWETLMLCRDVFRSDDQLRNVFVDQRIAPWATDLRDGDNARDRVESTISYLIDQERANTKANVLILFLHVLKDRYKEGDNRREQLDQRVKELEPILQGSASSVSPRIAEEANPDNQPMTFTAELLRLSEATKAVSKISVPRIVHGEASQHFPSGTAWLIAPGLAITCWHVMKARTRFDGRPRESDLTMQVQNSVLIFDYMLPGEGVEYQLTSLECYDTALDYVLLSIKDRDDVPLHQRGFLKLDVDAPLTLQTELCVIQHPGGQIQKNSLGRFVQCKQGQPERILHKAPTEAGTSGAPVLNVANWRVVALHNGEDEESHLREATLLKKILSHIQQKRLDLYRKIMDVQ